MICLMQEDSSTVSLVDNVIQVVDVQIAVVAPLKG